LRILFFSRDLGGANQLVALQALLSDYRQDQVAPAIPRSLLDGLGLNAVGQVGKIEIVIVAKDYARQPWIKEGIACDDWNDLPGSNDPASGAERVLDAIGPNMLITATSDVDDRTDVSLWSAARHQGIPSAAFVDHGVCLRERFLDGRGRLVMPDKVFLPDADLLAEIRRFASEAAELIVCEDLHLLHLPAKARRIGGDTIVSTRRGWAAADGETIVLFPSEPRREIARAGRVFADYEDDVLERLSLHLAGGEGIPAFPGATGPYLMVVRPHPKDTPGKYDAFAKNCPVPCVIDQTADVVCSILSADVVVGIDSTVMFECQALGRPVYGLVEKSLFIERAGPAHLIRSTRTAEPVAVARG
jgi:hypothetical protein